MSDWVTVLLASIFGLVLVSVIFQNGPAFPRVGKSRLRTLLLWQKPTRFDMPRYVKEGYEQVCIYLLDKRVEFDTWWTILMLRT